MVGRSERHPGMAGHEAFKKSSYYKNRHKADDNFYAVLSGKLQ